MYSKVTSFGLQIAHMEGIYELGGVSRKVNSLVEVYREYVLIPFSFRDSIRGCRRYC